MKDTGVRPRFLGATLGISLLSFLSLGHLDPLAAQDPPGRSPWGLQLSGAIVEPGQWPRVFGERGADVHLTLIRSLRPRVRATASVGAGRLSRSGSGEPLFFADFPPYDNVPDARRGMHLGHVEAGLRFELLPTPSHWSGAVRVGAGATRLTPVGQSAYPSPPETRAMATTGVELGRRLRGPWALFVSTEARRIFGIDLTGLPDRDATLGLYAHSTRVGSRWIREVAIGLRMEPR